MAKFFKVQIETSNTGAVKAALVGTKATRVIPGGSVKQLPWGTAAVRWFDSRGEAERAVALARAENQRGAA
ncbi:hypothetical protein FACS189450_13080 [Spirochaetia bacterium]|nr:hypothetical protein FACS189450_13080 [Spirochaetia bacterium]